MSIELANYDINPAAYGLDLDLDLQIKEDAKPGPAPALSMRPPDAEQWAKQFDEILRRYRMRLADATAAEGITLEQAVAAFSTLGIASGDAMRYLAAKSRPRLRF